MCIPNLEWPEHNRVAYEKMIMQLWDMVHCDPCVKLLDAQNKRKRAKSRYLSSKNRSVEHDWILPDVLTHTLKASNRTIEDSTPEIAKAFDWAREWKPRQEKNSAFVEGTKGSGKSYFAHCVLNVALQYGISVREIQALEIQELATDWDRKRLARKTLTELKRVGCLLIEEIGLVPWNDYGAIALREVIDYRYRMHTPILITSNLSIREMRDEVWASLKNKSIIGPMLDRMQNFVGMRFVRDKSLRTGETVQRPTDEQEELAF